MKKRKYFGQKDTYSCGPVALMNVLAWAGYYVDKHSISAYRNMCHTIKNEGTWNIDFDRALKFFKKYKVRGPLKTRSSYTIDKALARGELCVISYHTQELGPKGGHFAVILKKNKYRYITVNNKNNEVFGSISRRQLNLYLAKRKTYADTQVWYIKKK